MARKQMGQFDEALLEALDKRAEFLGVTRRVYVERTLWEALSKPVVRWNGTVSEGGTLPPVNTR